jgi:hypothetical protein
MMMGNAVLNAASASKNRFAHRFSGVILRPMSTLKNHPMACAGCPDKGLAGIVENQP